MPDLNLIDEGGIEESSTPSAPLPPRRSGGGGSLNKILMVVLVLLVVGTTLFYLYKKGKFPFKKKAPVTMVQEQPFEEPPPQQQPMATTQNPPQGVVQPIDTASVPLLETPPVEEKTAQPGSKLVTTSGAPVKGEIAASSASKQKLTDMKGNYTVQVAAFRDKKRADLIVDRLAYAGYPAFVETIPMKGQDWHTVRIGHYSSRADAKKAVADFAAELRSSYYIEKVKSK
jgi:septal ring-binding cell division protein DamX